MSGKEGTATLSWANPFRASPRAVPGETAGHERATPMTTVGSRNKRASRQAPGPSLAGHRSCAKYLSSRTPAAGHPLAASAELAGAGPVVIVDGQRAGQQAVIGGRAAGRAEVPGPAALRGGECCRFAG